MASSTQSANNPPSATLGSLSQAAPASVSDGWRALCVCSGQAARRLGVVLLTRPDPVGAFAPLGSFTAGLAAGGTLLVLALGFLLAGLVARPVKRLAEEATASLPGDLLVIPEAADEVARIDGALLALRLTAEELGDSREELRETRERLDDKERLLDDKERQILTDDLTGVWNRRYLEMGLADAVQRGRRWGRRFVVLMIDLDHFKEINDTFGHRRGDEVLIELCQRIRSSLRANLDVIARYGGEEFVVLLPETNKQGGAIVAEKIRRLVKSEPFGGGDEPVRVTVSIGLASYPTDGDDPDRLLALADANMYRAKQAGRNRVMAGT